MSSGGWICCSAYVACFTFVIWDRNKQELFGARDHFGIKPFYYAKMNGTFMYASEIKEPVAPPLISSKELNAEALKPYMTFQYPAIGGTFFKGVFKLPEGHYFTYRTARWTSTPNTTTSISANPPPS